MTIASNIRICISDDYQLGAKSAVPFGGFYSCEQGNPLANENFNRSCPNGFSNHLATIDNGCEIEYCIRLGLLSDLKFPTVHLPPFFETPAENIEEPANYIISYDFKTWLQLVDLKTEDKSPDESSWTTLNSASGEMTEILKKFSQNPVVKSNDDAGMSNGAIVGLSVCLTTAVCLIVGIGIRIRRHRKNQVC